MEPVVKHKTEQGNVEIGDEVWVKHPNAPCTTEWRTFITEINSQNNVSVDGTSRHILDGRPVIRPPDSTEDSDATIREKCDDNCESNMMEQSSPMPRCNRQPPARTIDYAMDY